MKTVQNNREMVTIEKEEYEALLHMAQVTKEYLQGKAKSFRSAESLIENLKGL